MTTPQPGACAAPGCPRPHAHARGLLCGWHHDKLGQALADLGADLTATSTPAMSGWRTGSTSGGPLASERDPINLRMLDAQTQAPPVLAAWAGWLCAQRPDLTRAGGAAGDRTLLARHFDWICEQPEIVQFWCQLRALWASLRGHLPVRRCTCGGPVWTDRGGGWCSWCATVWAGRELLELDRHKEAA